MEGPEKSVLELAGKPLIAHTVERLEAQVQRVIINANGDPKRFAFLPNPVEPDTVDGFAGPLAGILAAMRWSTKHAPEATHVLTVAADTPFFPSNLANRFSDEWNQLSPAQNKAAICLAYSGGNRHPVFGLWPVLHANALEHFLIDEELRKVMLFVQRYHLVKVEFPLVENGMQTYDPFFNINTPDDFKLAESLFNSVYS